MIYLFIFLFFSAGNDQPPANSTASPTHSASVDRSSSGSASPAHRPPSNEKTVENWEDTADNSEKSALGASGSAEGTPATTPEEEENSIDNETFVPASKPRTKVKPKVEEATTTEKEHVNVVFIGHVGMFIYSNFFLTASFAERS